MSAVALVLNKNFQPIDTKTWEEAITSLFQGKAVAVDTEYRTYDFTDWCALSQMMSEWPHGFVSSTHMKIAIPEAIRFLEYDKVPNIGVVFTRRNALEHYKYRCAYCGHKFRASQLNYEHILPQSRGGKTTWANVVPACYPCNNKKANRTPEEANMRLLVKPCAPKHQSVQTRIMRAMNKRMRLSWQHIIDEAYWSCPLEE